jgi:hypothetical protein
VVATTHGILTSSTTVHINVLQRPAKPAITVYSDGKILYSSAYQGNQWYKDTTAIVGAVATSYIPTASGIYSVKVIDYSSCGSDRSAGFQFPATGLPTSESSSLLDISPNPFTGVLILKYTLTSSSPVSLKLCDLTGQVIKQLDEKSLLSPCNYQSTINLKSLQKGIYLIVIKTSSKIIIRKVVKN